MGTLALNKGRIRNSSTADLPEYIKKDPELANSFDAKIFDAITEAISGALLNLSHGFRKIAVIEHLVFQGTQLFIGVYFYGKQVVLEWYETSLPVELQPNISGSRGTSRCQEALSLAQKLMGDIETHSQRCSYLLGPYNTVQSEVDKTQLREWAAELHSDSSMLGHWFFPLDLLDDLKANEIGHVVLIPDPAFATVPYPCLETQNGLIVDMPWTLSIVTSSIELVRLVERSNRIKKSQPLYYVAPNAAVNSGMGGNEEQKFIEGLFLTESSIESQSSVKATCEAFSEGRWVHFRGHGLWTKNVDTSGLIFSESATLDRAALSVKSGSPGFLATAACRTGFNTHVGTELFGLLTQYDSASALGALLTAWPIHGPAATHFMEGFYNEVSKGADVALALQGAMRRMRDSNPHPYLWAPFFLIGGWMANELLVPKKKPEDCLFTRPSMDLHART